MRALVVLDGGTEFTTNESYNDAVDSWETALKCNWPVRFTRPDDQMPVAVLPNLIRAINGAV